MQENGKGVPGNKCGALTVPVISPGLQNTDVCMWGDTHTHTHTHTPHPTPPQAGLGSPRQYFYNTLALLPSVPSPHVLESCLCVSVFLILL